MLELFDDLELPAAALFNTDLYHAAPRVLEAFRKRGDELTAHGRTNAEKPGSMSVGKERELLTQMRDAFKKEEGNAPKGYLATHISVSKDTPRLLYELGFEYQLDFAMDDQPVWLDTDAGQMLSVPYAQEINDIPQLIGRNRTGRQFADMITDAYVTLHRDAQAQSRVFCIALHPYLMGQAHRFTALKRALTQLREQADGLVWFTTPGEINDWYRGLEEG